jgi:hypothetical protein
MTTHLSDLFTTGAELIAWPTKTTTLNVIAERVLDTPGRSNAGYLFTIDKNKRFYYLAVSANKTPVSGSLSVIMHGPVRANWDDAEVFNDLKYNFGLWKPESWSVTGSHPPITFAIITQDR